MMTVWVNAKTEIKQTALGKVIMRMKLELQSCWHRNSINNMESILTIKVYVVCYTFEVIGVS